MHNNSDSPNSRLLHTYPQGVFNRAHDDSKNYGTATWRYWQKIENDAGARGSFQTRPPVRVRARLIFERDGAVWVDGTATRLGFDGAIFVENSDRRCQTIGVWLPPADVWWAGKLA